MQVTRCWCCGEELYCPLCTEHYTLRNEPTSCDGCERTGCMECCSNKDAEGKLVCEECLKGGPDGH